MLWLLFFFLLNYILENGLIACLHQGEKEKKIKHPWPCCLSVRSHLHLRVDVIILLVVIVSAMEKVVIGEKNHPEPSLASRPLTLPWQAGGSFAGARSENQALGSSPPAFVGGGNAIVLGKEGLAVACP